MYQISGLFLIRKNKNNIISVSRLRTDQVVGTLNNNMILCEQSVCRCLGKSIFILYLKYLFE